MGKIYRVVQWATGKVGSRSLRARTSQRRAASFSILAQWIPKKTSGAGFGQAAVIDEMAPGVGLEIV